MCISVVQGVVALRSRAVARTVRVSYEEAAEALERITVCWSLALRPSLVALSVAAHNESRAARDNGERGHPSTSQSLQKKSRRKIDQPPGKFSTTFGARRVECTAFRVGGDTVPFEVVLSR